MNSIVAQEQSNTSTYTLSRATFNAATQDEDGNKKTHLWHFQTGNCTLSLMNGVGGTSAGNPTYNDDRIAFFEGVQFQLIGIPENESITSVTFEGNGVNKTCYLTEMDGTSYGTSDGAKSLDVSSNAQSIAFDFESNPIGRNFTFTFSEATAQISQIVIKTKKLEALTANNHTWDFNEWLQAGNNGFTFGKTALKGYTISTNKGTTYYDSGRGSENNGFRAITMAESDRELTSTQGIQVNGRSQLYNNAISILGGNCIKFHVEKGQQIVFNIHSHLTGNSVTYSLSTDASNKTFATDAIINEWGYRVKGSELTSQAQDIKLVALESGDFIIQNVSSTLIYVQKIELSNFKPNVIWSDTTPLVNTATGEKDFTKDMALSFPSNNQVKFAITECGEGTATWKSFNTKTGEIKGINGKGGLVVKAYFPTSNYFTYADNKYVLNVTNEGIHFAEKAPHKNWSKQGYVTYAQKLMGDGLTFSAAPRYEVISKPEGWKAEISQDSGSPDYVLSVLGSGSGTVTVKGTFGNESDTYYLYISGLNFGNNSPSIAYGTTEYEQGVIEAQDASSSSDVTYSLGTAVGVTAQIDATTGKLTNISGSGAIQVIAKSNNSDLEAEYVLTVGCDPSKRRSGISIAIS